MICIGCSNNKYLIDGNCYDTCLDYDSNAIACNSIDQSIIIDCAQDYILNNSQNIC